MNELQALNYRLGRKLSGVVFTIVGYNRLTCYQRIRWDLIASRNRIIGTTFIAGSADGRRLDKGLLSYEWPLPNDTRLYRHDNPIWGASCAALGIL